MDIAQRPDGDFQSGSDLFYVVETRVALGALHGADVGAMEPAQFREHLLGPSALLAVAAHAASEALTGRAGHGEQPCTRGEGRRPLARSARIFLRISSVHSTHERLGEAVGAEEDPPSEPERVEVVRSGEAPHGTAVLEAAPGVDEFRDCAVGCAPASGEYEEAAAGEVGAHRSIASHSECAFTAAHRVEFVAQQAGWAWCTWC